MWVWSSARPGAHHLDKAGFGLVVKGCYGPLSEYEQCPLWGLPGANQVELLEGALAHEQRKL